MRFRFHPAAEIELQESARYYHARKKGLGRAFLTEIRRAISLVRVNPGIGTLLEHDIRRFGVRRFPYSVLYSVDNEELTIVAVMHQKRRPGYWLERM